jgi:ketosteroid isomerase-like protein
MSDIRLTPAMAQPNSFEGGANAGILHTSKLGPATYRTLTGRGRKVNNSVTPQHRKAGYYAPTHSTDGGSMDRQQFQAWLDAYVDAWKTYDEAKIAALFADDVEYRYHPHSDPVVGRAAVVKDWLDNKDDPGTYDGEYRVVAIDGETHVANGHSDYFEGPGGPMSDQYFNVYICRFNDRGECTSFTEYWMQHRDFRTKARAELIAKVKSGEVSE